MGEQSLKEFSDWLANTPASLLIADRIWVIAVSQTVHILAVTMVMVGAVILNLRLLGVAGRRQSVYAMTANFLPWMWGAVIVLLITGIVQTVGEPGRELLNIAFRVKMTLLVCVLVITYSYWKALSRDAHFWDPGHGHRGLAITLATISLVFWVGIVISGRLIAYMDLRHE